MTTNQKQTLLKWAVSILTLTATTLVTLFGLQSCNVTRTITTQSNYLQRGDTSIIIQTKTIEVYDATKKL